MSIIGSVNPYSAYSNYHQTTSTAGRHNNTFPSSRSGNATSTGSASAATTVTLSASARAVLASKSFSEVTEDARTTLTALLEQADSASPYSDGKLVIDLSGFDRRSLFAIANNETGIFSSDEMRAASDELTARFDSAMAGPLAVYKVTGNISQLYEAALTHLDSASPEEQSTIAWTVAHDAVEEVLAQLNVSSNRWPSVAGDPVVAYLGRIEAGTAGGQCDFATVAANARTALDVQAAETGDTRPSRRAHTDLSSFSGRALSAIALNEGDQFSSAEVIAAKKELTGRACEALVNCVANARSAASPTALAENIISAYGSLSSEERQAIGWNEGFYQTALANYQSAAYFSNLMEAGNTGFTGLTGSGVLGLFGASTN